MYEGGRPKATTLVSTIVQDRIDNFSINGKMVTQSLLQLFNYVYREKAALDDT